MYSRDANPEATETGRLDADPEIEQALIARRKIVAIARYRRLTGARLRDCKQAVDEYERRLRALGRIAPEPPATLRRRMLVAAVYSGAMVFAVCAALIGLLIAIAIDRIEKSALTASYRLGGIVLWIVTLLVVAVGSWLLSRRLSAPTNRRLP